ncbi:unnamed protein product [Acanthoscelides obtectus]|uniref:Uncharacterized protein n=1 Tax=Acanthoscelides obtectus TaxID=200917 RepID=A0A9P0LAE8_ACAOB|nr:unnamed protein product [Acanthoscelides obtectus]CAK1640517.1 hypothetical protein AOBTE_LOCUS11770 [Acanthoscelides obtectus]
MKLLSYTTKGVSWTKITTEQTHNYSPPGHRRKHSEIEGVQAGFCAVIALLSRERFAKQLYNEHPCFTVPTTTSSHVEEAHLPESDSVPRTK